MKRISLLVVVLLILMVIPLVLAQQDGTDEPPSEVTDVIIPPPVITDEPTLPPVVTDEPTEPPVVTDEPTDEPTMVGTEEMTMEPTAEVTGEVTPTATAPVVYVPPPSFKADPTLRIAIITAYAPEIDALLPHMQVENTYTFNGIQFKTGWIAGHAVVLFSSGTSMINAAMNTQLVIDRFNIQRIIFSGIAGGVNPDYHIGDVVIPAQWAQYEETVAGREQPNGSFSVPSFASTDYPPFGFWFPQPVTVSSASHPEGENIFWFSVDPAMLANAQDVAGRIALTSCTAANVCLLDQPLVHVGGYGVSGQTFVDNADYRDFVYGAFGADALDMETAAAMQVAYANNVPFLAFRSLSDLAGGGDGENEIGTFFTLAADNAAKVTVAFLTAW